MAVYDGKTTQTFSWSKGDFYFVEKPSHILNEGYPLDSISILPENGKYFVDLTREEKDNYKSKDSKDGEVIKFILESLNFKSADSLQRIFTKLESLYKTKRQGVNFKERS